MEMDNGRSVDRDGEHGSGVPELLVAGRDREPHPRRTTRTLVAAVVVLALVAGGLGAVRYRELRQTPDGRALAEAVSRLIVAWDAGDEGGLLDVMTPGGTFVRSGDLTQPPTALTLKDGTLADFIRGWNPRQYDVASAGPAAVIGERGFWWLTQPVVVTEHARGVENLQEGFLLLSMVDINGQKKVQQMVWWTTHNQSRPAAPGRG
jgi:hypothetical protein